MADILNAGAIAIFAAFAGVALVGAAEEFDVRRDDGLPGASEAARPSVALDEPERPATPLPADLSAGHLDQAAPGDGERAERGHGEDEHGKDKHGDRGDDDRKGRDRDDEKRDRHDGKADKRHGGDEDDD